MAGFDAFFFALAGLAESIGRNKSGQLSMIRKELKGLSGITGY
jgi:hypothetical protein